MAMAEMPHELLSAQGRQQGLMMAGAWASWWPAQRTRLSPEEPRGRHHQGPAVPFPLTPESRRLHRTTAELADMLAMRGQAPGTNHEAGGQKQTCPLLWLHCISAGSGLPPERAAIKHHRLQARHCLHTVRTTVEPGVHQATDCPHT
jgi:hypothetical protein